MNNVNHVRRYFSEVETATLRALYPVHGPAHVAQVLDRTLPSVKNHAMRIGVRYPRPKMSPEAAKDLQKKRVYARKPKVVKPPRVKAAPKPAPAPKPAKVKVPAVPAVGKALPIYKPSKKEAEPVHGLAAQLRALPFTDPLRQAYLRATRPGTKAGSAPRTISELQRLAAGKPSLRKR